MSGSCPKELFLVRSPGFMVLIEPWVLVTPLDRG